jgi:hypothetical protein
VSWFLHSIVPTLVLACVGMAIAVERASGLLAATSLLLAAVSVWTETRP